MLGFELCSYRRCLLSTHSSRLDEGQWKLNWGRLESLELPRNRYALRQRLKSDLSSTPLLMGTLPHLPQMDKASLPALLRFCRPRLIPLSFRLPDERSSLHVRLQSVGTFNRSNPRSVWLLKRERHRGGGISLVGGDRIVARLAQGDEPLVVQEIVEPPMLVDGRMVDVGVHALVVVGGVGPMRAYALRNWRVRVAAHDFALAARNDKLAVVTNAGLETSADRFKYCWRANVPSFRQALQRLECQSSATEWDALRTVAIGNRIHSQLLTQRVHATMAVTLQRSASALRPQEDATFRFFRHFRFDFAVRSSDWRPLLLEVQAEPDGRFGLDGARRSRSDFTQMLHVLQGPRNEFIRTDSAVLAAEQQRATALSRLLPSTTAVPKCEQRLNTVPYSVDEERAVRFFRRNCRKDPSWC